MKLSFQRTMKLYSFSLALYLGFSFMSYVIRKDFGLNSAIFFMKLKKTTFGFHYDFMD